MAAGMHDFNVAELWNGLGRLYDSSLNTLRAVEELRGIVESHERRLDRFRDRDSPPQ